MSGDGLRHILDIYEPKLDIKNKNNNRRTHHWSPCCHSGLFGEQRLQIRAQYEHALQLVSS